MSGHKNQRDELLRRFEAVISGAELDDLRQMVGDLSLLGAEAAQQPSQPHRRELRRPPLADVMTFRVRVDLRRSKPRIWRRLDLRSDLTLCRAQGSPDGFQLDGHAFVEVLARWRSVQPNG